MLTLMLTLPGYKKCKNYKMNFVQVTYTVKNQRSSKDKGQRSWQVFTAGSDHGYNGS